MNGYVGWVKVVIPLPKGHRDKTFSCYRLTEVDGKMVKEMIPVTQTEDSYDRPCGFVAPVRCVYECDCDCVQKEKKFIDL